MNTTDTGNLIFFAIIDDRLGLKEGTQDQKLLFYYAPNIPFESLVVSVGHMQTVMGICSQFKAKAKYFRTKLTVTFFDSPQEHIYYILRVGRVDCVDVFPPFVSHLIELYKFLYNDDYTQEMKPTIEKVFKPVFQNYRPTELMAFDYNFFEHAVLTHKSYLYLSTIIERTKQKFPELVYFVIVYGNSILHSDLSRGETLTLYLLLSQLIQPNELQMASQELNSLIPSLRNGWVVDSNDLVPIFLQQHNKRKQLYLNIHLRKKSKSQILFIPIFDKTKTHFFDSTGGFDCELLYKNALKGIISLVKDSNIVINRENLPLHLHLSFSTNSLKSNLLIKSKNVGEFLFVLFLRRFVELMKANNMKLSEIWVNSHQFSWVAAKFGCARELYVFSRNLLEVTTLKHLTEEVELLSSPIFI
ncbi:CCZ1/INTU/HSP4 first Longin domain-containing protein [Entamoeba marina]